MTNHTYDREFYQIEYERLVKVMRERDMEIVKLQKELECTREQVNDLLMFQNIMGTFRQFFSLITKPQPQRKIS